MGSLVLHRVTPDLFGVIEKLIIVGIEVNNDV